LRAAVILLSSKPSPNRIARGERGVRGRVVVALVVMVLAQGARGAGQEQVISREYEIKARVLAVLGKCVTWPPESAPTPQRPLTIGVLGDDPFLENGVDQLDRVARDEAIKGNEIRIKRFASRGELEFCHVLFLSRTIVEGAPGEQPPAAARERVAVIQRAAGSAVLIVGESDGLAQQGAVANLVFDRATNLIRLEINPDAAARAGLKLQADLLRLKLVRIVRDP
jgi:hypothetical protein